MLFHFASTTFAFVFCLRNAHEGATWSARYWLGVVRVRLHHIDDSWAIMCTMHVVSCYIYIYIYTYFFFAAGTHSKVSCWHNPLLGGRCCLGSPLLQMTGTGFLKQKSYEQKQGVKIDVRRHFAHNVVS